MTDPLPAERRAELVRMLLEQVKLSQTAGQRLVRIEIREACAIIAALQPPAEVLLPGERDSDWSATPTPSGDAAAARELADEMVDIAETVAMEIGPTTGGVVAESASALRTLAAECERLNLKSDMACADRDRLAAERDKLQAFKDWVHNYLDQHAVPHHPPGTHGAAGCRIGDRMDWLMAKQAGLAAEVERLRKELARILAWEMPPSNATWEDGRPMSYSAAYGSNGERDVIKAIARNALENKK